MINVNELRIGNWVDVFEKHYKIVGATSNEVSIHNYKIPNDDYDIDIRKISPIPLTSEILLKAGFESIAGRLSLGNDDEDIITFGKESFDNGVILYANNEHTGIVVKYLHQLQNLFFSLTNTELQIEL